MPEPTLTARRCLTMRSTPRCSHPARAQRSSRRSVSAEAQRPTRARMNAPPGVRSTRPARPTWAPRCQSPAGVPRQRGLLPRPDGAPPQRAVACLTSRAWRPGRRATTWRRSRGKTPGMTWLPSLLFRLSDHLREPLPIRRRELPVRHLEQSGNGIRWRAIEERLHDVAQRRAPHLGAGGGRLVHVAEAILLVREVALVLEEVEHRPHGRVARRVREVLADVADRGAAEPVDDVHDLSLAATEVGVRGRGHQRLLASGSGASSLARASTLAQAGKVSRARAL